MALSTLTLTTARTRIAQMVVDTGLVEFNNDLFDNGLRLALDEYSRVRPYVLMVSGTFTPGGGAANGDRILQMTRYGFEVAVVWRYYTTSYWEAGARRVPFRWWERPAPPNDVIEIEFEDALSEGDKYTVRFHALHLLNGLDGAVSTTFSNQDETLILLGACGHACLMKSVDEAETTTGGVVTSVGGGSGNAPAVVRARSGSGGGTQTFAAVSGIPGNYAGMGAIWLKNFRDQLRKPKPTSRRFTLTRELRAYFDPTTLGWK